MKYFIPLEPNKFYHIFNHAVGNENFFRCDDNYFYFIKKYIEYISPVAKTYAFVLMPNHFHYLLKINEKNEIYKRYLELELKKDKPKIVLETEFDYEKFVMQQFSNFFNSYTKSYNKKYDRKGALFIDYLRRIEISEEEYQRNLITYIHQNPINHKFCDTIENWKFSSYKTILSQKLTLIERNEVLNWFGGVENFIFMHQALKNLIY